MASCCRATATPSPFAAPSSRRGKNCAVSPPDVLSPTSGWANTTDSSWRCSFGELPERPRVVVTGYDDEVIRREVAALDGEFLVKPVTLTRFREALKRDQNPIRAVHQMSPREPLSPWPSTRYSFSTMSRQWQHYSPGSESRRARSRGLYELRSSASNHERQMLPVGS